MTVLYADDDADDLNLFTKVVQSLDPEVKPITFNNGEEIVKFLETSKILTDVIFLDINMPGMDGFECLEKIRSLSAFHKIPVVILSTSGEQEDVEKSLRLGATAYIQKPYTYHEWRNNLKMYIAPDADKKGGILQFVNLLHGCLHSLVTISPPLLSTE